MAMLRSCAKLLLLVCLSWQERDDVKECDGVRCDGVKSSKIAHLL